MISNEMPPNALYAYLSASRGPKFHLFRSTIIPYRDNWIVFLPVFEITIFKIPNLIKEEQHRKPPGKGINCERNIHLHKVPC